VVDVVRGVMFEGWFGGGVLFDVCDFLKCFGGLVVVDYVDFIV